MNTEFKKDVKILRITYYRNTCRDFHRVDTGLKRLIEDRQLEHEYIDARGIKYLRTLILRHTRRLWRTLHCKSDAGHFLDLLFIPRVLIAVEQHLQSCAYDFNIERYLHTFSKIISSLAVEPEVIFRALHYVELCLLRRLCSLLINHDDFHRALSISEVRHLIAKLFDLNRINKDAAIAALLPFEQFLRADPINCYSSMDYPTKNRYRRSVINLSRKARCTPDILASTALKLAESAAVDINDDPRRNHIGYYLVDDGQKELLISIKGSGSFHRQLALTNRDRIYLYLILNVTLILIIVACVLTVFFRSIPVGIVIFAILPIVVLAADAASKISRAALARSLSPTPICSMDYWRGVPTRASALLCVPTILANEAQLTSLLLRTESNFRTANPSCAAVAILADYMDSPTPNPSPSDLYLRNYLVNSISKLNHKYGESRFFALFRDRHYCETQKAWIGRERKFGKIYELFDLIIGKPNDLYVVDGNLELLKKFRYVMVLDDDSVLERYSLEALLGAIEHPLNSPRIGANFSGHGIVFPQLLNSKYSRADVLPRIVRDPRFEWLGYATFPGKGLYDAVFSAAQMCGVTPNERVLSHDTVEAFFLRPAFVMSAQVRESAPSDLMRLGERWHRWVRGDWQNFFLIITRKLSAGFNPALGLFIAMAKLGSSLYCILMTTLMFLSAFSDKLLSSYFFLFLCLYAWPLFSVLRKSFLICFLRGKTGLLFAIKDVLAVLANLSIEIVFMPFYAFLSAHAICITVARFFITKHRLLDWQSSSYFEGSRLLPTVPRIAYYLIPIVCLSVFFLGFFVNIPIGVMLLMALWATVPLVDSLTRIASKYFNLSV